MDVIETAEKTNGPWRWGGVPHEGSRREGGDRKWTKDINKSKVKQH